MAYRIEPFPMNFSDFNAIHLLQAFLIAIFRTVVQQLTRFQLTWGVDRAVPLR